MEKHFSPENPLTYLITEGRATPENFAGIKREILSLIEVATGAQISFIQIREKQLPARLVFELATEAVEITRRADTKILVNDRADIALAASADGVHLTAASLPTDIIRLNFSSKFIIGVSAHSLEEAERAARQGADFVTVSPIFPTPEKEKYGAPQGLEKLGEVCRRLKPFPVIALGGINENNYKSVLESGASGFAAIRFLNNTENLRNWALSLRVKSF